MGLRDYHRKRDFGVTSEPKGGKPKPHRSLAFVIQKHAASHLHYDFRLELNGFLKSWAVPKGPSLDPATKRLAMHVEDHPLEYGDFEGIIPEGEYGGGTVLLWDKGSWKPVDDARQGYRDGRLKFDLFGEKLKGRWMLVRKGGSRNPDDKNWFLFKENDEFAQPGSDIEAAAPLSVTTGRGLDEIAADSDRVWGPGGEVKSRAKKSSAPSSRAVKKRPRSKPKVVSSADRTAVAKLLRQVGKKRVRVPADPKVELATLVSHAPRGDEWMHEIKFDGYRMLCRIANGKVRFISRNGKDWTARFKRLARNLVALPVKNAIIDGEVVLLDENGRSSFQFLQNAFKSSTGAPFLYYAFDLLFLDGYDLTDALIEDRKSILYHLLSDTEDSVVRYSGHVIGKGPEFFAEAAKLKLEGIISKRSGRSYVPGRGSDWLKVKCSLREEFVIGGFTKPSGSRKHFGALLVGYYDRNKNLIYAGRVGTGFTQATLSTLRKSFDGLIEKTSSFENLSGRTGQAKGVTWLKPKLVAQVEFSNWTEDKQLRHPSFQGLREDKAASSVVRDDAVSVKTVESAKSARGAERRKKSVHKGSTAPSNQSEVAGVCLSHPDKVLYPEDGVTKLDLANYYEKVAKWILPQVNNRLLSLVRCPGGSGNKCFFQKHPADATSELLKRTLVHEKQKTEDYLSVTDISGIIALVQMGVLEIHVWGSTADDYEKPDRLIFDLDPDPSVEWPAVVVAAKEIRLLLKELGLTSFVKTTGGKGLHIVVPVQRRSTWDEAKVFCKGVADFLVAAAPDRYIAKMSKAARKNKIFVDYLRNDQGSTAVAAYSTRNRPGATVSVPIPWNELDDKITSDYFNISNLPGRLARLKKDPWAGIDNAKQFITAAMMKQLQLRH